MLKLDWNLIVGVTGVVATIGTGFGTWWLSTENSIRFLKPIGNRPIEGMWVGSIQQEFPGMTTPLSGPFKMELRTSRKLIKGNAALDVEIDGKSYALKFNVSGGFHYQRFLRLEYWNSLPETIEFGSIVAELSEDGSLFQGSYTGYGHLSKRIVTGNITLVKTAVH